MQDIARLAKVSSATVSRSFDPARQHLISDETRKAVYAVADSLGYRPNRIARALRRCGTETIALVLPESESEYIAHVIMRTASALGKKRYDLKIHTLLPDDSRVRLSDVISELAVDGLIIAGLTAEMHFLEEPSPNPLPAAVLNEVSIPTARAIVCDNAGGGRSVAELLVRAGHTKLGMLAGPSYCSNARDRRKGFISHLRERGRPVRDDWYIESDYGEQRGYDAMRGLVQKRDIPTAVFCVNDELARGALRALRDSSLSCPEDVSIIGFDDFASAQHTVPPLTTVHQPIDEMVVKAIEYVTGFPHSAGPESRDTYGVHVVERASVAPLRDTT